MDSNGAHLNLLEEMGITPDFSFHEKKASLKSVGIAVLASVRMRKMAEEWRGSRKVQESLVRKLEGMGKGGGKSRQKVSSSGK